MKSKELPKPEAKPRASYVAGYYCLRPDGPLFFYTHEQVEDTGMTPEQGRSFIAHEVEKMIQVSDA